MYMQVAFQAQQLVLREKLISPHKNTNHTQQQEVKRRKTALVNRENGNKYEAEKATPVLHLQLCQFRNTSIPEGRMNRLQQVCSRVVPKKDLRRVGCVLHHQLCMFALQTLQEFHFLEGNDSCAGKNRTVVWFNISVFCSIKEFAGCPRSPSLREQF